VATGADDRRQARHSNVLSKHPNVLSKHPNVLSKQRFSYQLHKQSLRPYRSDGLCLRSLPMAVATGADDRRQARHSNVLSKHPNVLSKHPNVLSKQRFSYQPPKQSLRPYRSDGLCLRSLPIAVAAGAGDLRLRQTSHGAKVKPVPPCHNTEVS
jgi:hypothetical protein